MLMSTIQQLFLLTQCHIILPPTFEPLQFLTQKTRLAHIDYEKDGLIN